MKAGVLLGIWGLPPSSVAKNLSSYQVFMLSKVSACAFSLYQCVYKMQFRNKKVMAMISILDHGSDLKFTYLKIGNFRTPL